jgi:hypothetical protein
MGSNGLSGLPRPHLFAGAPSITPFGSTVFRQVQREEHLDVCPEDIIVLPPTRVLNRLFKEYVMSLNNEILARIRAARAWDKDARPEDFQLRAAENGSVLINLKTRRAQLIYDEDSELRDMQELFPNLVVFPK